MSEIENGGGTSPLDQLEHLEGQIQNAQDQIRHVAQVALGDAIVADERHKAAARLGEYFLPPQEGESEPLGAGTLEDLEVASQEADRVFSVISARVELLDAERIDAEMAAALDGGTDAVPAAAMPLPPPLRGEGAPKAQNTRRRSRAEAGEQEITPLSHLEEMGVKGLLGLDGVSQMDDRHSALVRFCDYSKLTKEQASPLLKKLEEKGYITRDMVHPRLAKSINLNIAKVEALVESKHKSVGIGLVASLEAYHARQEAAESGGDSGLKAEGVGSNDSVEPTPEVTEQVNHEPQPEAEETTEEHAPEEPEDVKDVLDEAADDKGELDEEVGGVDEDDDELLSVTQPAPRGKPFNVSAANKLGKNMSFAFAADGEIARRFRTNITVGNFGKLGGPERVLLTIGLFSTSAWDRLRDNPIAKQQKILDFANKGAEGDKILTADDVESIIVRATTRGYLRINGDGPVITSLGLDDLVDATRTGNNGLKKATPLNLDTPPPADMTDPAELALTA